MGVSQCYFTSKTDGNKGGINNLEADNGEEFEEFKMYNYGMKGGEGDEGLSRLTEQSVLVKTKLSEAPPNAWVTLPS